MELSAATPTTNPTATFSLLPLLGNNLAASTGSSASPAQDFRALLTEMTGTNPNPTAATSTANQTQVSAVSQTQPAPQTQPGQPMVQAVLPHIQTVQTAQTTQAQPPQPAAQPIQPPGDMSPLPEDRQSGQPAPAPPAKGMQKTQDSKAGTAQNTTPGVNVMVASMACVSSAISSSSQVAASPSTPVDDKKIKADDASAQAVAEAMRQVQQPELERAFAEVTKFEYTVQPEAAQQAPTATQENDPAASMPDALKAAVVATDPIVTVQQQQLPLRIAAVQPVAAEAKPSERSKTSSTSSSDTIVSTTTSQAADLVRPVQGADQVLAANPIEIPNMPHLPVVRTIAIEVGDPGSQVTIHMQERGGDIAMQLNTGSAPLHQDLQSSVGSLAHSLKQGQIQVSNIEVTRKSPIDKVRRMKEAQ